MAKSTEVAKAEGQGAVVAGAFDYGEMAGSGFEDVKGSDLSIPFMNVLQSNSPEVEDQTIDGATAGQFLNTVTSELTDKFCFLPVHKEEAWVEWVPRTRGGGFVAMHDPTGEIVQSAIKENGGSRIPPKGSDGKRIPFKIGDNELIETYYVYGLLLNEDGSEVESFAVLSFSSTKIKPYRDWLTSMYLVKGENPIFAHRARFGTVKQKNESGSFFNLSIMPLRETWASSLINPAEERSLLEQALDFRKMVLNGVARADFNHQQNAATGGDGEGSGDKSPF